MSECFICGDPANHDDVRHSEATGDSRTRADVGQDRTWPVGQEPVHAETPRNPASGAPDREPAHDEPTVHDYTRRYWGHDYTWTPEPGSEGRRGEACGWGGGIKVGHYLALQGPNGGGSLYRVEAIRYELEPNDMWWATLVYARV